MLNQPSQQDDDEKELILGGDPPDSEIEDVGGADGFTPDTEITAKPVSSRASRAAAERSRKREADQPKRVARNSGENSKNPYRTRTTADIRAEREARRPRSITELSDSPRPVRREPVLDQTKVAELLRNPTRTVSEDQLKQEYAYVTADLRSMGLLSLGLIVVLVVLAQILPR